MGAVGSSMNQGLAVAGKNIAAGSAKAATVISEKTSLWREQIAKQNIGSIFTAMFTRKKDKTFDEAGEVAGEPKVEAMGEDNIGEKAKAEGDAPANSGM